MAVDDEQEKSLFHRIKDCVLTELRRDRQEMKNKEPCKPRSIWEWWSDGKSYDGTSRLGEPNESPPKGKVSAGIDESSKGYRSSDQRPTRSNDSMINGCESPPDGISPQQDKRQTDDTERNYSSDKSDHTRSRGPDKCKSLRRYYIKMQNPEAPVCCEHIGARISNEQNTK